MAGQQGSKIVRGKGSGTGSVGRWADIFGLQVTRKSAAKVLQLIKARALEKRGLVSISEFYRYGIRSRDRRGLLKPSS